MSRWKMCACGIKMSNIKQTDNFIIYECHLDGKIDMDVIVGSDLDIKLNEAGIKLRKSFIQLFIMMVGIGLRLSKKK